MASSGTSSGFCSILQCLINAHGKFPLLSCSNKVKTFIARANLTAMKMSLKRRNKVSWRETFNCRFDFNRLSNGP